MVSLAASWRCCPCPTAAAFLRVFLRSQVRFFGGSLPKTNRKKTHVFVPFWVKKHGVAFPEVIEKTCSVVTTWGQVEERRRRSSALDKLCSRIINAMRFACRPDTHYGMSSTGQCCDQDCCPNQTNQTKQKKRVHQKSMLLSATVTKPINVKHFKTTHKNTEIRWRPCEMMLPQNMTNLARTNTERWQSPHPKTNSCCARPDRRGWMMIWKPLA